MAEIETTDPFVESLFRRAPADVVESLTEAQLSALKTAFARTRHTVDIRKSTRLLGKAYYFVVLMGGERRPRERLRAERRDHPIWTVANIVVFVVLGTLLANALVQVMRSFSRLVS